MAHDPKSRELGIRHEDGSLSDEELHRPMLEGKKPVRALLVSYRHAIRDGRSAEEARKLFGLTEEEVQEHGVRFDLAAGLPADYVAEIYGLSDSEPSRG